MLFKIREGLIYVFLLFMLLSCGDGSPLDEDYWGEVDDEEETGNSEDEGNYSVQLSSLSSTLGTISGSGRVEVGDSVSINFNLSDLPPDLIQGHRSFTNSSCEEIASIPFPEIPNNTGTFKNSNYDETISRDALQDELEQTGSGSGLDLTDKRFVVSAFVINANSPSPQATSLIPIVCGTLVRDDDDGGTTSGGTTTGGTITGGTTGGVVGGAIGSAAGGVGGEIGSVAGGVGGSIGGTVGGTTAGF